MPVETWKQSVDQGQARRCIALSAILALTAVSAQQPAIAQRETFERQTPDIPMTYKEMTKRFDCAFFVEAEDVDHFMNYKGSPMSPVTRVTVSYRQYQRPNAARNLDLLKYKEIYYSGSTVIGSHQFQPIDIQSGSVGAIRLVNSDKFADHLHPIVNSMIRAFMDLNLNGAILGLVLCPKNQYMNVITTMQDYNFYPMDSSIPGLKTANVGKKNSIILHFYTEPRFKEFEKSYCFISSNVR